MTVRLQVLVVVSQKNALALARGLGLDNKNWGLAILLVLKHLLELVEVLWQQKCFWVEFVLVWKLFAHFHEVASQVVLAAQLKHSWKMVCFLIWLHFENSFSSYTAIGPVDVPVFRNAGSLPCLHIDVGALVEHGWLVRQLVVEEVLGDMLDDEVLAVAQVDHQALAVFEFGVLAVVLDADGLRELLQALVLFLALELLDLFWGDQFAELVLQ